MSDPVSIVEVGPRDRLQNEKTPISVADRIAFIEALIGAGLRTVEVGAFVSPKAIPSWPVMIGLMKLLRRRQHTRPAGFRCSSRHPKTLRRPARRRRQADRGDRTADFFIDATITIYMRVDHRFTPLLAAHHEAITRKLLASGADVRAKNRRGAQPIHYAADGVPGSRAWDPAGQGATVAALIAAGADPNALDKSGVAAAAPRRENALRRRGEGPARRWRRYRAEEQERLHCDHAGEPEHRSWRQRRPGSESPAGGGRAPARATWRIALIRRVDGQRSPDGVIVPRPAPSRGPATSSISPGKSTRAAPRASSRARTAACPRSPRSGECRARRCG